MDILPVLDLRAGRCNRLLDHAPGTVGCVYSTDPLEQALGFQEIGARWLQIVDLDGAFSGRPANLHIVEKIAREAGLNIQFAGGLRSRKSIDAAFAAGASRVVLSTAAIRNPQLIREAVERYGDRIVAGIDIRDGRVAIEGWLATVSTTGMDLAKEMAELGISRLQYSDIRRNGSLKGPNLPVIEELIKNLRLSIIVSGGIGSLEDIRALKALGVEGAVIGKALYSGIISMEDALNTAR